MQQHVARRNTRKQRVLLSAALGLVLALGGAPGQAQPSGKTEPTTTSEAASEGNGSW